MVELKEPDGDHWIDTLIEIYKPTYSDAPNRYTAIGELFEVQNPGSGNQTHQNDSHTIHPSNSYLKFSTKYSGFDVDQKGETKTIWTEDAHLTHSFKSNDYDIGRYFIKTEIERGKDQQSIVHTNAYFEGTQINGLSQADYDNITYLPSEYGKIYSLQNQSGILKAIQAHKVTAFYSGQWGLFSQRHEFQSNYGTIHPATVIQSPSGYIYGFDVYRETPWRDTGNGIHPLAGKASIGGSGFDYKMESFFREKAYQLRTNGTTQGSNDVVAGFDTQNGFYYLSFVDHVGSGNTETVVFSEKTNRWIGFVDITPQKYGWGQNLMVSSDGADLYKHESDNVSRLKLYGTTQDFSIEIIANEAANLIKLFNGIRLSSSVKMDIDPITIPSTDSSVGREMVSKLSKAHLKEREGVYRSSLLKNMKTTSSAKKNVELYTGESMKGFTLKIKLKLDSSSATFFELFKVDILSEISY